MLMTVALAVAVLVLARFALPTQHLAVAGARTIGSVLAVLVAHGIGGQIGLLVVAAGLLAVTLSRASRQSAD